MFPQEASGATTVPRARARHAILVTPDPPRTRTRRAPVDEATPGEDAKRSPPNKAPGTPARASRRLSRAQASSPTAGPLIPPRAFLKPSPRATRPRRERLVRPTAGGCGAERGTQRPERPATCSGTCGGEVRANGEDEREKELFGIRHGQLTARAVDACQAFGRGSGSAIDEVILVINHA